jgi:hypothetical protein
VVGLFAIEADQLVLGRWAAQLLLNRQEALLQLLPADLLEQTPKSGRTGGRVATVAQANAQGSALGLAQAAGELG